MMVSFKLPGGPWASSAAEAEVGAEKTDGMAAEKKGEMREMRRMFRSRGAERREGRREVRRWNWAS